MEKKIVKRIERIFKGVSNHNRIKILEFIAKTNETTLWVISQELDLDFRLASHHTAILQKAGLIEKEYIGREVGHFLTPYGKKLIELIKTLGQ